MKFKTMDHMCKACGKLRNKGFHDICSKRLQAQGNYKETVAPKVRAPHEIERFVRSVSKL